MHAKTPLAPAIVCALASGLALGAETWADAQARFAATFYRHAAAQKGNLCFSPVSIAQAFAMMRVGATGETAAELDQAFAWNELPDLKTAYAQWAQNTQPILGGTNATLHLAAGFWKQNGTPFQPAFTETLRTLFKAGPATIDFRGQPEAARATINNWTAAHTLGRIPQILPPGSITPDTALALVSAVAFAGDWERPFDARFTRPLPFRGAQTTRDVPMMSARRRERGGEDEIVQTLELPYVGDRLVMLLVLPKTANGLAAVEAGLDGATVGRWRSLLKLRETQIQLPKFKFGWADDLTASLPTLGAKRLFTPAAELGGIVGTQPLHVSAARHQAEIEVFERGTIATAATGIGIVATAMPRHEDIFIFHADHPFLFCLLDATTGTIWFMGRVNEL